MGVLYEHRALYTTKPAKCALTCQGDLAADLLFAIKMLSWVYTGNLCRFGGYYGSKPKALIPGSELFVPFWKHFNPVYWIERLQMIS